MTPGFFSRFSRLTLSVWGILFFSGSAVLSAQISITGVDIPFTQNFNSLATSGTSSTVPAGWAFLEAGGNTLYTADNGGLSTSDTYSYGTGAQTDRAFGELTDPVTVDIGASFTNNTGVTITSLLIQFVAEQWRLGATGREDRMDFQYSTNATSLSTGTWTDVNPLDLIAPVQTGSAGSALNGNLAANRTLKGSIISGLTITNGSTFWIRWRSFNAAGADDGIAIDDFVLTANPATHYNVSTAAGVVTITDADGNSENLSVTETGSSIRFYAPGRTYSLNMGAATSMPFDAALAGLILVTVNGGTGNDTITLGAFTNTMPSLTCNGGIGHDRILIAGDITFSNNRNLDLDLQDDTGSPGLDHIEFVSGANLTFSGTGFLDMKVSQYVKMETTSSAITSNGAITVEANWQTTPSSGSFKGLEMVNAILQSTGSGTVSVKARGGNSGTAQSGILLNGSDIRAGASGTLTVEGVGGELSASVNVGLWILSTSEITTTGANIHLIGTGATLGSSNRGILMATDALIQAGGNGDILMEGAAGGSGADCSGVDLEGGTITTNNGDIQITGEGSGTTTSNFGISCGPVVITAGGTGNVTLDGSGGTGNSFANTGVELGSLSSINTVDGDITFNGIAGGVSAASLSYGVSFINGALVHAGGTGILSITGTGSPGSGGVNHGINMGNGADVTTDGGNILLTGNGGGSGTGNSNAGISIGLNCLIQPGGAGFVLAQGTGGNSTGGQNHGIQIIGASAFISSSGGPVTLIGTGGPNGSGAIGVNISFGNINPATGGDIIITGTGGQNSNAGHKGVQIANSANVMVDEASITITGISGMGLVSEGIFIAAQANVITTGGFSEINLIANSMIIGGEIRNEIPNPDVKVSIRPYTAGVGIHLGSLTDPIAGPLQLSDAELDSIFTSELIIGHVTAGDIVVLDTITRTTNTKMSMTSAADIQINGGYLNLNGGSLSLNPGVAPAAFSAAHTGNDVFCNTMSINGTLEITINGGIPESQYEQINVTGVVSLSGTMLSVAGTYNPQPGDQFTIIVNDAADAIAGTFAGLAEGATIPSFLGGNLPATISYIGGTGNDVVITVQDPDYIITTAGNALVVTDVSGNGDVLTMTEVLPNIQFNAPGRTFSLNGGTLTTMPANVSPVGINSVTINAETGTDQIVFSGNYSLSFPSLTVNGGVGDDIVQFNGDINFSSGAHLDVDLQDDDSTPGTDQIQFGTGANLYLSGSGVADLKASQRILFNSSSGVITQNGNLILEANQQAIPTTGSFIGISLASGSLIQANGTGILTVRGKGGNTGGNQNGININGGDIIGGSVGTTMILGIGGPSTTNTNTGITVTGAGASITSLGSHVQVNGTGGGSGSSVVNIGVNVGIGGMISAGGSGNVIINGVGGSAGGNTDGVRVSGANAQITSSGGNVTITGMGGGAVTGTSGCHGVNVVSSGTITCGGSGLLSITGTGGPGSIGGSNGIMMQTGGMITSNGGDISLVGNGGGSGSSPNCIGISMSGASFIQPGGTASLTMVGIGGTGTGIGHSGIVVSASSVTSNGGHINVTGIGVGGSTSSSALGVSVLAAGSISAGSTGNLTIHGTGGSGSGNTNTGVFVQNATLSSVDGHINLTGLGNGGGTASNCRGVHIQYTTSASVVTSTGTGTITISGTGGDGSGTGHTGLLLEGAQASVNAAAGDIIINAMGGGVSTSTLNYGIQLSGGSEMTATNNGDIHLTGRGGAGTNSTGIFITDPSGIYTLPGGGDIRLTANSMNFSLTPNIYAPPSKILMLEPADPGVDIHLGGSMTEMTNGPVVLFDFEMDSIQTGLLIIGNTTSGGIFIDGDISRPFTSHMWLRSGENIEFNGGLLHTSLGRLLLDPGPAPAVIRPFTYATDVQVDTLYLLGNMEMHINSTVADTGYSILTLTGKLSINNSELIITGTHTPSPGESYYVVVNDGSDPVSGTFSGLPEGAMIASFMGSLYPAQITYAGGNGNDIVLTVLQPDYLITTIGNLLTITDLVGYSDELTVSENAGQIRFHVPGRNYLLNNSVLFNMPADIPLVGFQSILINTTGGTDTIELQSFTTTLPSLTINGGEGDDGVNVTGDIIFANDADLNLNLQNDHANPGTDRVVFNADASVSLTGTGEADIRVSRDVRFLSNASLTAEDGNMIIEANMQSTPSTGNFIGLRMQANSLLEISGTGILTCQAKGGDTGNNQHGIGLFSGADIHGGTADTTWIEGNGGASNSDGASGIYLEDPGTSLRTNGGHLSVIGYGGGSSNSFFASGITVANGAELISGGVGELSVEGHGGDTTLGHASGVFVTGPGSLISSEGGDIYVEGNGGMAATASSNPGVYLFNGGDISAPLTANIEVTGEGGFTNSIYSHGIYIAGGSSGIQSIGGNIILNGQGGGSTSGNGFGISIEGGGKVETGFLGDIFITATGSMNAGGGNHGLILNGIGSQLKTTAGDIQITAQGGGTGAGGFNYGLLVTNGASILSTLTGNIHINATGGMASGDANYGILMTQDQSLIQTNDGNLIIEGQGGGTGTSGQNIGVYMFDGMIKVMGDGLLSIEGTAGSSTGMISHGVFSGLGGNPVISSGGKAIIAGQEGPGPGSFGVMLLNPSSTNTMPDGDDVLIRTNNAIISSDVVTTPEDTVYIIPADSGIEIKLGGGVDQFGGPLSLMDAELDSVMTGHLVIGYSLADTIVVMGDITREDTTHIILTTGGDIVFDSGLIHTGGGNLILDPGPVPAALKPRKDSVDAVADTVSIAGRMEIGIYGVIADTLHDQLHIVGRINLTNAGLFLSGMYIPSFGDTFVIVRNDGTDPIIGQFISLPEGATISNFLGTGVNANITYMGGDGNDVVLRIASPDYLITDTGGHLIVTDLKGNSDNMTVSQNGSNIRFQVSGRTFSYNYGTISTLPADVALSPLDSITINLEGGNDFITFNAFTFLLPTLHINGGTGNESVMFSGDITFATDADLIVNLQDDDPVPGLDQISINANTDLLLSGTGRGVFMSSTSISITGSASLRTANGDLIIEANYQPAPNPGSFSGVTIYNSVVQITGTGSLQIRGRAGTSNSLQHGVRIEAGGDVIGGIGDSVVVQGTGGQSVNLSCHGVWVFGTGSHITSGGADVYVLGFGGGTSSGSAGYNGVEVASGGIISAGNMGNVFVSGTGGNGSGTNNNGVRVINAGSTITSSGGHVLVTGFGAGSAGASVSSGVQILAGGIVTAGAMGTVTVVGTGGANTGNSNNGINISGTGSMITSSGGTVEVTGQGGGTATSNTNLGINLFNGGVITAGGMGEVHVNGTGGLVSGNVNYGISISSIGSMIHSAGGNVIVTGQGGGTESSGFNHGVTVGAGGVISAGGMGQVEVNGAGGPTTGSDNYGVYVFNAGATITSSGGDVTVTGVGGGTGVASSTLGVYLNSGGTITAGNSGNVVVMGTGGPGTGAVQTGVGIYVNSTVSSAGGDVTIIGNGGPNGSGALYGVILSSAIISTTGDGHLALTGTGGQSPSSNSYGVYLTGSTANVSTLHGNVSIMGTGGGISSSSGNAGVNINNATVESTGIGQVMIEGFGGAGAGAGQTGVILNGGLTKVQTANGHIQITGQGSGVATSNSHIGIQVINGALVSAGGDGQMFLHGQGGSSSGTLNMGMILQGNGTKVTSASGSMTLLGEGGGTGGSPSGIGISIEAGTRIEGPATAPTHIHGIGGPGTGSSNYGIYLNGSNATMTSDGGDIFLTGVEGNGANGYGMNLSIGTIATDTFGGNIVLRSNSILNFIPIRTTDADTVSIVPFDPGVDILLGTGPDLTGGPLSLTDLELDSVMTGYLVLGSDTTGMITVAAEVTRPAPTTIWLRSDEDVVFGSGSISTNNRNLFSIAGPLPDALYPVNAGADALVDTFFIQSAMAISLDGILPDTEYDQLNVMGHIDLQNASLLYAGSYTPMEGDSFVIVLNDGTDQILGTFAGLPEGDTIPNFLGGTLPGVITYEGGTGNDAVIRIVQPCLGPNIPTLSASPDTLCEGAQVTLSITNGDLNQAATWQWYSGSCGGTPVDTGLMITVSPTATTTYFVRGEGGCVSQSDCAETVVVVNPFPDATIDHTFSSTCYFTDNVFQPDAAQIPGAEYTWSFGSAATPPTATGYGPHVVQYTTPGSKTVKLVIQPLAPGANCPDSSTISFSIANCPAQLLGRVQADNGTPISSVNVRLFADANADGVADNSTAIRSVFTPSTGSFAMASLTPGHYVIVETQPVGWNSLDDGDDTPDNDLVPNLDSLDNLIPVTLSPLEIDTMNVFVETPVPGNISGVVFQDFDLDQSPDPGEGLPQVMIRLFPDVNADGQADTLMPLDSVATDSAGLYMFPNIPVGHYVLVEADPVSWTNVKDFDATNDGDLVPNTNMVNDTLPVSLSNGENDANNYFIDNLGCSRVVTNTFDNGPGSLREALACAISGDTISFHTALAGQTIVINSDVLILDKDLTILSALSPTVTISSQINGLIEIQAGVNVEWRDLKFISGLSPGNTGAAFLNAGVTTFHQVTITRNPLFTSGEYLILNQGAGEIYISGDNVIEWD